MRKNTPYSERKLLGTRNVLRFKESSSQSVTIPAKTYNLGSLDFMISVVVEYNENISQTAVSFANSSDQGFYFLYSGSLICQFRTDDNTLYQQTLPFLTYYLNKTLRVTYVRRGAVVETYVNNRLLQTDSIGSKTFNLGSVTAYLGKYNAGGYHLNGSLSNFIFCLGFAPTQKQLEELHNTNIIPAALHPYVVAHYPLNQNVGLKAWDVVEQYNYSRSTPYDVTGYTSGWEFFVNGNSPTITYGSDGDGNYAQLTIDSLGRPSYFTTVANQAARISGCLYRLTFVIKRVAGTGNLNLQQFGAGTQEYNYGTTELPNGVLKTIDLWYTATTINDKPLYLLAGLSSGGSLTDSYRVYAVKNSPILTANHGDLINYTNDEAGVTNPLLQTAWQNIYSKKKDGLNFLKFENSSGQSGIPSFTGQTFSSWSFYFEFSTYKITSAGGFHFAFYNGGSGANVFDIVYDEVVNRLLIDVSSTWYVNLPSQYKVVKICLVCNGSNIAIYLNGDFYSTITSFSFSSFPQFLFSPNVGGNIFTGAIHKARFFNRVLSAHEIQSCFINTNLSNSQFDIDFGDIFLSSGNYFARDNSGNNRHAQLYNWTPATDQPLRIEQHTGLPERRKALRFNGVNQYLSINSFSTNTNKHTIIIQYKIDNIADASTAFLFGNATNENFAFGVINSSGIMQFRHIKQSSPVYHPSGSIEHLVIGKLISSHIFHGGVGVNGFNTYPDSLDTSNLFSTGVTLQIGSSIYGTFVNGYISHFSVFSKQLSQAQILDIINNGLAGNAAPSLMSDCQLYLNFEEIINDSGTYKIKDWSPQNRTVVLNNYTANEINPVHPDYKLFDLDTLR